MTNDELKNLAGEIGEKLATDMTEKSICVIDGFPTGDDRQRGAIAALIGDELHAYAERMGV